MRPCPSRTIAVGPSGVVATKAAPVAICSVRSAPFNVRFLTSYWCATSRPSLKRPETNDSRSSRATRHDAGSAASRSFADRHVHLPGEDARLGVARGEDLEEETLPAARKRRPIALLDHERRRRRRHRTDEFVGVLAGHGQGSQAVGVPAERKLPQAVDECGDGVRGRSRLRNCRFAGTKHERERQQEPKGHGCTILDPSFDKETRPI